MVLPAIWGAIMFSRIITYYLGTVYISPSSVTDWHSLSRALYPLHPMKRSTRTLLQIMHFTGGTLVDFLYSVDDLLTNLAIEFRPLFGIQLKKYSYSIKHDKTTHYPIYSIKLITFGGFVRSQPIAGRRNYLSPLALPWRVEIKGVILWRR